MNNYLVSPFIFNSLYQVGTTVCRSCGYVTTNIWEISGSWAFLQASILQICPHTGPLSQTQTPRVLIPYGYLRPTLRISWAYIDHIFALHIGPVTFPEHFQHTLNSSFICVATSTNTVSNSTRFIPYQLARSLSTV